MTPNEVAERLRVWATSGGTWAESTGFTYYRRRVELVEHEGPRRTWLLFDGTKQVGHVRLRERQPHGRPNALVPEWHMETSRGIAREALGLDTAPEPGQTDQG
jgi:hypothetical protein